MLDVVFAAAAIAWLRDAPCTPRSHSTAKSAEPAPLSPAPESSSAGDAAGCAPAGPPAGCPARGGRARRGGVGAYVAAGSAQTQAQSECLTMKTCSGLGGSVHTWDYAALGMWIGAGARRRGAAVVLWTLPVQVGGGEQLGSRQVLVVLRLEGSF